MSERGSILRDCSIIQRISTVEKIYGDDWGSLTYVEQCRYTCSGICIFCLCYIGIDSVFMSQLFQGMNFEEESINWLEEARRIIADVGPMVQDIHISSVINCDEINCVFLNIRILEGKKYSMKLCFRGFTLIGEDFDLTEDDENGIQYETIYALLDQISPMYRQVFSNSLSEKLLRTL